MRLLLLLLVGGMGAAASAWALARGGRAARLGVLVGVIALVAVTVVAFLLRPARLTDTGQPVTGLFEAHLVSTVYLRLVVGLWGLESLLVLFGAWLLGGVPRLRGLLPATLAAITGGTVAMASADLTVGAAAAAATGLAALVVVLAVEGPAAVAAGARELRVSLATGAALLLAMAVVPLVARLALIGSGVGSDEGGGTAAGVAGTAMGAALLVVGLAVAARAGLLPFHVRVSRLTDLVPPEALPLLLAWAVVPLAVVAFAVVDRLIAPLALPLEGERVLLVLLAAASLVGASLAALVHDDLRHTVAYLVIADAALLLLALAALDPAAWGPGRAWVVVLAASKTAMGAWAAVIEDRFQARSIPDLRGWGRRSPLLAAGLVLTAVATFGLPGWIALEARGALAAAVAGPPWREALVLAGFLALPAYLRLTVVGLGAVTSLVDGAAPERIVRRRSSPERLDVEHEGTEPAPSNTQEARRPNPAPATAPDALRRSARSVPAGVRDVPAALRRNRTELLSGTVLALAILAALTSWGALDLAGAAAEPAPILLDGTD